MRLTVNGEPCEREVPDLAALFAAEAEERGIESAEGIAIAVNGRVVRIAGDFDDAMLSRVLDVAEKSR